MPKTRFFLGHLSCALLLLISIDLNSKRALRSTDPAKDPKPKEFVVLTSTSESIIARLGKLYDRLKLFANNPKELKTLQADTDKLEESLRDNVAKVKDINLKIGKTKMEVAKLRNEIPLKKTNAEAKKVLEKITEQFNDADKEMANIAKLTQDFEGIGKQIKEQIGKINVSLESGNQEIESIKEELEKIAAMQEAAAGKEERDIVNEIETKVTAKKANSKTTAKAEVKPVNENKPKTPATKPEATTKESPVAEQSTFSLAKQATLNVVDSLMVLGKIAFKFATVAFMGAKDLVARFSTTSTVVAPAVDAAAEKTAVIEKAQAQTARAEAAKPEANTTAPTTAPAAESESSSSDYLKSAASATMTLGKAMFGLMGNAYDYLKQSYAQFYSDSNASSETEEETNQATVAASVKLKPVTTVASEVKVEAAKPAEPTAKEAAEKPVTPATETKSETKDTAAKEEPKTVTAAAKPLPEPVDTKTATPAPATKAAAPAPKKTLTLPPASGTKK